MCVKYYSEISDKQNNQYEFSKYEKFSDMEILFPIPAKLLFNWATLV